MKNGFGILLLSLVHLLNILILLAAVVYAFGTIIRMHFKSFRIAGSVLAGVELIHMIREGQLTIDGAEAMSFADQFSALGGMNRVK